MWTKDNDFPFLFFKLRYLPLELNSQKRDETKAMKCERAPINAFYKWRFWCRRRRGCMYWALSQVVSQFPCIVCTNQTLAAGLAQSLERSTAEREVAGSISGAGPILRVLK